MAGDVGFAGDGCVLPNVARREYRVSATARCEHEKVQRLEVWVLAQDPAQALRYAQQMFPRMRNHTIVGDWR